MVPIAEAERIERVLSGDRAAFDALFEEYLPALWRHAIQSSEDRVSAEALVRTVLTHALQTLCERPEDRPFAEWLRALADRCAAERIAAGVSAARGPRGSRPRAAPSPTP
jgi:DNA-directed RNA polymerase specialized sigma24 family protein